MELRIVGDQTTPDDANDFVARLVDVACDLAEVAVVLNDSQGLDVAGNYIHKASNIVATEQEMSGRRKVQPVNQPTNEGA